MRVLFPGIEDHPVLKEMEVRVSNAQGSYYAGALRGDVSLVGGGLVLKPW